MDPRRNGLSIRSAAIFVQTMFVSDLRLAPIGILNITIQFHTHALCAMPIYATKKKELLGMETKIWYQFTLTYNKSYTIL